MHWEGGVCFPHSEDYIAREIRRHGQPYEWEMLEDMCSRLEPGDWVMDAGAHCGNHTKVLLEHGCRVIAVEPVWEHYLCLVKTCRQTGKAHNAVFENMALGSKAGECEISEYHHDNTGATRLREGSGIPVSTIDVVVSGKPLKALKIDCEGAEMDILKGAHETLSRKPLVYIETVHARRSIGDYLARYGYERERKFGLSTLFA